MMSRPFRLCPFGSTVVVVFTLVAGGFSPGGVSAARLPGGEPPTVVSASPSDRVTTRIGESSRGADQNTPALAAPVFGPITTNLGTYPSGQVPRFDKFEITFELQTVASNPQWPYDPTPPAGVMPGAGVSVDAQFTPDNWATVYSQPAFYYQEFDDQIKSGREWFYPTGRFLWKVRFSPDRVGTWQYKLVARDAGGTSETAAQSFNVSPSGQHGFVRVSQSDPRYFEFDDGAYFPGLGYNMNYDHVAWGNPVLDNESNFQIMGANGIQLIRIWLTEWGIYTSAWNPWNAINGTASYYIPWTWETFEESFPGSDVSMEVLWDPGPETKGNPCMFIGAWKPAPAVKPNTNYVIRIRYKTANVTGPRIAGKPYGFVGKLGGWLWGDGTYCYDPGTGTPVTGYQAGSASDWQILQGAWNSGQNNFLPYFYLALENVTSGKTYIDYVWIQEDLGGGNYGPNIVSKPWMAHHNYFEQRNSYAFDKVLELAEQYGIYIRPVILEKNEWISNRIDFEGNLIPSDPRCEDSDPGNDPEKCPGNDWFYGNWRGMSKGRWLQQTWWRYLQARWGYSPNIHSWELLNEGDPWHSGHYTLADEFGKYMHQFAPNDHLVSTSNWHSFPKDAFWANPEYPNIDFADYHRYIPEGEEGFLDTAYATYAPSMAYGARQAGGAGKPVIRGETGFVAGGSEPPTNLDADTEAVWLHNYIWGGINAGGLIESYWYENSHIYRKASNGGLLFDHRPHYRTYYNFIKDIPLNNGSYQDAQAVASDGNLRAWGQKDLVNGRAHLWIQNKQHTWKNVVDGVPISPLSGTVRIDGFQPGGDYRLEWWDPYESDPAAQVLKTEVILASPQGTITINLTNLVTDVAVKIRPTAAQTFADVPLAHPFYDEIEALYRAGYTAGCGTDPLRYCPDQGMTRAEGSVFVERGIHGVGVDPVAPSEQVFVDMPLVSWAAKWVTALYRDQYTAGCATSPLAFCPWQQMTRTEGSVFFLRMLNGVGYLPPGPTGLFADVSLDWWGAKWAEAAYGSGLIPACAQSPLRFCPEDLLSRGLAAYMMVQAKDLTLP